MTWRSQVWKTGVRLHTFDPSSFILIAPFICL
uniref:Uncharacterized protein n=1 Tax=Rhizophora mucronata TaxID=61149 RepID=A0A2P2N6X6_RHIMU